MLSLEDVLKIPPNADEEYYRSKGLLPQPAPASPAAIGTPTGQGPTSVLPMSPIHAPVMGENRPPYVAPHGGGAMPVPPNSPELTAMTPPTGAGPEVKPMTPPTLNFKEREALPTTSPGVLPGTPNFYENKIERIEDQKANPWGTPENHPGIGGKIAHIAAKVGNIAGDIVAPNKMAIIPGTELNREMQENAAERKLGTAKTQETTAAVEKTREKHEENLEDVNQVKLDQAQAKIEETQRKDLSAREVNLRKQGLKLNPQDPNGTPVPLAYEDMSPQEQAVHDLKVAQADSQTAKAALDKYRADPTNPQNQSILERVRIMAQNAATAAGKLGLDKDKFVADYFGLGPDGQPLPGTAIDPKTGKPIGPKVNKATVSGDAFVGSIQKSVVQAAATQDAVRRLMKILEPYKGENQPFSSFMKQLEYKLGKAQTDEIGQELAGINLASLQQAGAVMQQLGGTRSIQALKIAMQHTPDPLKDSVMLMHQKMQNIDRSLATFLTEADHYGRKKATAIESERMTPVAGGGEPEKPAAGGPPEGKVSVYDLQGNEHYALKDKVDKMMQDPKYKGWSKEKPKAEKKE